jgi:hypothetical protein
MATPQAIAATGQAILGLLAEARPQPEFTSAQFDLVQASDLKDPMPEGIALYLYRITIDGTLRNISARIAPDGRRMTPALPVDLHYLLIPFARDAVKQQRLLGWSMRILDDTPVLPSGLLNRGGPEAQIFRPEETVDLVYEPLTLQDMNAIWDPFKPNVQVAVAYVARNVLLESDLELGEGAPVRVREFDISPRVAQ